MQGFPRLNISWMCFQCTTFSTGVFSQASIAHLLTTFSQQCGLRLLSGAKSSGSKRADGHVAELLFNVFLITIRVAGTMARIRFL